MVKYIYSFYFVVASIIATAQGNNMPGNGNAFVNVSQLNVSNPAGNEQVLQNYQQQASNNNQAFSNVSASNLSNAADNQVQAYIPQQLVNSNKSNLNIQNLENNIGEPLQQQAIPQTLSNNGASSSSSGGGGISLPKISFGSVGASRSSSGKHQALAFSKKMKRLNRRICYAFSRKHHKSFVVDNCFFAWAK